MDKSALGKEKDMYRQMNPWKGFALGLVGGLVGVMAMDYFQQRISPLLFGSESQESSHTGEHPHLSSITLVGRQHREDESATAALGRIVRTKTVGEEPDAGEKTDLSYLIHWAYGISQGGLYGATRAGVAGTDWWGGAIFGLGLWLLGDELIVPLLGLQEGPTAYSVQTHLNRAAMHWVYGTATATATQLLVRLLA